MRVASLLLAVLPLSPALADGVWCVLAFHYRGAFGSEGDFSIDKVLEDADAAITYSHASAKVGTWTRRGSW